MNDLSIEAVRPEQVSDLSALAIATFRDTFGEFNTEPDLQAFIDEQLSVDALTRKLADPAHDIAVAARDGELLAYFLVVRDSGQDLVDAHSPIELSKLYVDRRCHRMGLGRRLMDELIARARRWGHDRLWLSVWEHNERAKAFYRRYPFEKVGTWEYPVGEKIDIDEIWVMRLDET